MMSQIFLTTAFLVALPALAVEPYLLDCTLEGGYPDKQIFVDEENGYVLYDAQNRSGQYDRIVRYTQNVDGQDTIRIIDQGMDISSDNEILVQANSQNSVFILIKESLKFSYAWVFPLPANDEVHAEANYHLGSCSVNPYKQPK